MTQSYASFRAKQLSQIQYSLDVDITQREHFSAKADIRFYLADNNHSALTLDFHSGQIDAIFINDRAQSLPYEHWFIEIPPHLLEPGFNTISIVYRKAYANDGQGLHQYRDQKTGNHYLYTQFEAYAANRFMPLFDQPDCGLPPRG